jgi:predicted nucleotidyltransferase
MVTLTSQVNRKLLSYFFHNPAKIMYVNEIAKELSIDKRNLVKKLRSLESEGLFFSRQRGNLKFYSLNKEYPFYQEYKKIVLKTVDLESELRKALKVVPGISEVYIYGPYALNSMSGHSNIHLLVVGSHYPVLLQNKLSVLQCSSGRKISVVNMDSLEFKARVNRKDPFVTDILNGAHIKLV